MSFKSNGYKSIEKYRPKREEWKRQYYDKHNYSDGIRRLYTEEEDKIIFNHLLFDKAIAQLLQRPIRGIQIRRNRIKRGRKEERNVYHNLLFKRHI